MGDSIYIYKMFLRKRLSRQNTRFSDCSSNLLFLFNTLEELRVVLAYYQQFRHEHL